MSFQSWLGVFKTKSNPIIVNNIDKLKEFILNNEYHCMGTSHSYNGIQICDSENTIDFRKSNLKHLKYNYDDQTVEVGASVHVRELKEFLLKYDRQVMNSGNYMDQTVVGALMTGTHGYGETAVMAESITEMTFLDENADKVTLTTADDELKYVHVEDLTKGDSSTNDSDEISGTISKQQKKQKTSSRRVVGKETKSTSGRAVDKKITVEQEEGETSEQCVTGRGSTQQEQGETSDQCVIGSENKETTNVVEKNTEMTDVPEKMDKSDQCAEQDTLKDDETAKSHQTESSFNLTKREVHAAIADFRIQKKKKVSEEDGSVSSLGSLSSGKSNIKSNQREESKLSEQHILCREYASMTTTPLDSSKSGDYNASKATS